jgi:hypothetical protein
MGATLCIVALFIIIGGLCVGTDLNPGLGKGFYLIGTGMVIMSGGIFGSRAYGNRVENLLRNGMRKVCEETSAMHAGVSLNFHVCDETKTDYIEVNVSDTHDLPTDQEYD